MFDVLILGVTDASRDPRLHRQIESLKGKYKIAVMANEAPQDKSISFFPRVEPAIVRKKKSFPSIFNATRKEYGYGLTFFIFIRFFLIKSIIFQTFSFSFDKCFFRRKIVNSIKKIPFRMILANDLSALPLAVWAAKGRPVVFDAHEYYPGQFPKTRATLYRRKYDYKILKSFLPICIAMSTVGEGIANLYRKIYNGKIEIVMNAPEFADLAFSKPNTSIRFVHHGAAVRGRNLESLLKAFSLIGKGHKLDLYLVKGDGAYLEKLKQISNDIEGVSIFPPVPMTSIVDVLNSYDVGIYALPPTSDNQKWALPNKFFEFIQARLAVVIGPSPEMAAFVSTYDLGIVSKGFDAESLAKVMGALTPKEILKYKENAQKVALRLSSEPQKTKIVDMVSDILKKEDLALMHE